MPEPTHKPSLLDRLREQSDAMRGQDTARRRPVEEALKDIDRQLWQAFKWLDEALHHLEVIRPQVAHDFRLDPVLTIASPRYDKGFVSYRRKAYAGQDLLEQVELFYRMTQDTPVVLKVLPAAATAFEEKLRAAHLPYQYQTEQDEARVVRQGVFTITPAVTASVRFLPDYRRQVVEVTLRNVDRFESVILEFAPEKLDEAALEDLVRFILGEANTFLRRAPLAGMGRRSPPVVPAAAHAAP
jgi:hypothetical protein